MNLRKACFSTRLTNLIWKTTVFFCWFNFTHSSFLIFYIYFISCKKWFKINFCILWNNILTAFSWRLKIMWNKIKMSDSVKLKKKKHWFTKEIIYIQRRDKIHIYFNNEIFNIILKFLPDKMNNISWVTDFLIINY